MRIDQTAGCLRAVLARPKNNKTIKPEQALSINPPSNRCSRSMLAVTLLDSAILARSHAVRRRRSARGEVVRSMPCLRLNSCV